MNVLGKPRAFSPLADQRWVTVALAYIKELDVVTTNSPAPRAEETYNANPSPKPKGQPKKKGKAAGRGGGTQAVADGEEV